MLSEADNEILTRVGAGTPMGELLRRSWIPLLFSWEVAADGAPERVRLLGEDLVAFRDSAGRVGLIGERCPHRRASLYFGRNEAGGLRCLYHGWKFDGSGACVDMPSEPPDSIFKDKVRTAGYPCAEISGIVWTYMGPAAPPPLPAFEWMALPEDHHVGGKRVQDSNWVQGMEGDLDQSHVSYTHRALEVADNGVVGLAVQRIRAADGHPRFEVTETPYGSCIAAGRNAPGGRQYWRLSQHVVPFFTMTGPYGTNPKRTWRAWVPIDDVTSYVIGLTFHPTRPLTAEERERELTRTSVWNISAPFRAPATSQPFGRWRSTAGMHNDFAQDREVQRTQTFSGIPEFWAQDAALQVSMGEICDRSNEHLGTSDLGIIAARRALLAAAKALRDRGEAPPLARQPELAAVRGDAILLPAGAPWYDATVERRIATPGTNPDCP